MATSGDGAGGCNAMWSTVRFTVMCTIMMCDHICKSIHPVCERQAFGSRLMSHVTRLRTTTIAWQSLPFSRCPLVHTHSQVPTQRPHGAHTHCRPSQTSDACSANYLPQQRCGADALNLEWLMMIGWECPTAGSGGRQFQPGSAPGARCELYQRA